MPIEPKTILVVEDNPELNEINSGALREAGYCVLSALTLAQAQAHLKQAIPDAIVLDILLPDGNGLEFCHQLRKNTAVPILFLTSLRGEQKQVEGILAGGDAFLTKPFSTAHLVMGIEALCQKEENRHRMRSAESIIKGPLTLNVAAGQALLHGRDMLLTPKEFALLLLLVQGEGKTLTKEHLYETVWNRPGAGDTRAVWVQMSRLRAKLAPVEAEGIHLRVRRGEGYQFQYTQTK